MFNHNQSQITYTQSEHNESAMLDIASIPSATVSQWQSNVKTTESGSAMGKDAQAVHASKKHRKANTEGGNDDDWQKSTINARPQRAQRLAATLAIHRVTFGDRLAHSAP